MGQLRRRLLPGPISRSPRPGAARGNRLRRPLPYPSEQSRQASLPESWGWAWILFAAMVTLIFYPQAPPGARTRSEIEPWLATTSSS
jgi:hypothetical protein